MPPFKAAASEPYTENSSDQLQTSSSETQTGKAEALVNATHSPRPSHKKGQEERMPIWWSNAIFFCSMHVLGLVGLLYLSPWSRLDHRTAWLCFASWQLATYGITMGYHRLWSHKAYTARMPLRIALAACGCLGFQGSIKWWVLRHRLHHRWTDSDSDPYDAQKGLLWSHLGWIFFKPKYDKLPLIDKSDLEADPVVRFQHKYYISSSLFLGLVLPTLVGACWGDALGGYIWGGVVARLLIWHCTFCINSLAHYLGDQPYSEDVTARGNYLLAILTGGEASHNFHHAFPQDYRNGPNPLDWDPTKLLIWFFHTCTNQVPCLRQTDQADIYKARAQVWHSRAERMESNPTGTESGTQRPREQQSAAAAANMTDSPLPQWPRSSVYAAVASLVEKRMSAGSLSRPLVLVVDGHAVDVSPYAKLHPGGVALLRQFAVRDAEWTDASEAFNGGYNNHGTAAKTKMQGLRIAQVVEG